jgi:ribA/ribD-fused uncharacterized protein
VKESEEQEATEAQDKIILGFSKKTGYEFLSNFYASTVAYEGMLYPTVEHAYQASKSADQSTRAIIKNAASPAIAKKLGQAIQVRDGWLEEKLEIMQKLIREKFENPFIRWRLKETSPKKLINENRWNDRFFGVVQGVGENHLGRILMEVREEIIKDDSVDE